MERFAQILYDLGKEIHTDLYPDHNKVCELNYHDELRIQLQYEERTEQIFVGSFLCDVPPGKYREKLLRAGLVSNGEYPKIGTLAYSEKNNKLTLFEYIPAENLTGEKLFKFLEAFFEKGKSWKDAVENGRPLPIPPPKNEGGGLFGLKL